MKKNLSKQSIFTILGILVIIASIPVAVLLVQQRQEIRKEASGCNASTTCGNCGGNSCTTQISGWNCTSLGNSSDCTPCWSCSQPATSGNTSTPTPTPVSSATTECTSWDSVNCRGCANGQYGPVCGDYGPGGTTGAAAWCACEAKCGGGVKSTNCGGTANPAATTPTQTTTPASSTSCTPGKWSPSLCTRCTASGEWPQGGIACPAGNLDFGSQNKDGDAGYTDAAHCDCQRRCWGEANMTVNCGGTVAIEDAPGNESTAGNTSRSWGLYKTGISCETSSPTSTPTPTLTSTPTPTLTITPTPTLTSTPTPTGTLTPTPTSSVTPTPTPTLTITPTPTLTSTPTPTGTLTPTPTSSVTPTPTPVTQLPNAGFTLPTFGAVLGGTLFVILASVLFLL